MLPCHVLAHTHSRLALPEPGSRSRKESVRRGRSGGPSRHVRPIVARNGGGDRGRVSLGLRLFHGPRFRAEDPLAGFSPRATAGTADIRLRVRGGAPAGGANRGSQPWLAGGPEDKLLASAMPDYWAAFARSGDPNSTLCPQVFWPLFDASPGKGRLIVLGHAIEARVMDRLDRYAIIQTHVRQVLCDLESLRKWQAKHARQAEELEELRSTARQNKVGAEPQIVRDNGSCEKDAVFVEASEVSLEEQRSGHALCPA